MTFLISKSIITLSILNISLDFNKKAFINVNDFKTFEDCVNYVIHLDDATIHAMSLETIYTNDEITHLIDDEWNKTNDNKTLNFYVNKLTTFLE